MNKSPIKIAKVQIFFLIAKKSLNTNRLSARNLQIGRGVWQKVVFLPLGVKIKKYTIFGQFGRNGKFWERTLILRL